MNRKRIIFLCAAGAIVILIAWLLLSKAAPDGLADKSVRGNTQSVAQLWGQPKQAAILYQSSEGYLLDGTSVLSCDYNLETSGEYEVWVSYHVPVETYSELSLQIQIGEQSHLASLPVVWAHENVERPLDRYGDEMNSRASVAQHPVTGPLMKTNDVSAANVRVTVKSGQGKLSLYSSDAVRIFAVSLVDPSDFASAVLQIGQEGVGNGIFVVEAENFAMKSDSYIRGKNIKNAALAPYDTYQEKINVIDASSWSKVGQRILWVMNVESAGWYRIGFRYSQYSEANKFSYRDLYIDGCPVTDAPIAFPSTGMNSYENLTVSENGQPIWVFLEAGEHSVFMQAAMDPLLDTYLEMLSVMDSINNISMDLRKLTAGNQDANRTWDMDQYLPEVPDQIRQCMGRIEGIYAALEKIEGVEPSYASQLMYAVQQLENLLEDERLIPNKTAMLSEGDGSVNSALGEVLEKLVYTPLSLDRIYFYQNTELPKASCNVFVTLSEGAKRLLETYMPGASGSDYTADGEDTEQLQVWVNMSISYAEVLQQMIDESYNQENGTKISIALMPNEQKLILANASGNNPDVVLGINFYTPYELAIRGAAKDLLEYEDFASFYQSQYNVAGLVPLAYDGGIYGAVDSLNYQVLFYRKDILESLELPVPETWDDVKDMMPTLLRYSMNFSTSLATGSSFKTFNMTGPFIYQNGGDFYSPDGASVAFHNSAGQEGLLQMTELFRVYSLTESNANFFNSFRYGETPLGVGNFSTYVQLMTAAPELEGKWGIALIPGELQEDGSVAYYQAADSTASMIFDNTDKPDEAWDFLKWWLSSETQAEFSNRLESTYGPAYRWNTANLKAFAQLPYPEEDKQIILEQISYQKETGRHPAGYMVEREVSNIWNQVVVNGKGLTESIDRAVIVSNREIIRKLQEFGFMDENGNLIKPYTTEDIITWMKEREGGGESETD